MRGLISLVNDNHVDSSLKEILVYVYLSSIVKNCPQNRSLCAAVFLPFVYLLLRKHITFIHTSNYGK